jgi:ribonucleoside-diphosphate reductase alpha chain
VARPFAHDTAVDYAGIEAVVRTAVRMLDNTIDISQYPLEQQRDEALRKRRMGIGVTGLADMLVFLGLRCGAAPAAIWLIMLYCVPTGYTAPNRHRLP